MEQGASARTILVTGGAGRVGHYAIQWASQAGATVIAVAYRFYTPVPEIPDGSLPIVATAPREHLTHSSRPQNQKLYGDPVGG